MIKIDHIKKEYGYDFVLDDISFVLNKGDKLGLVGRNGTGKSTLLKIIIGQVNPDEGQVTIDRNEKIAYLPQDLDVYSNLSLKEFMFPKKITSPLLNKMSILKQYLRQVGIDKIDTKGKVRDLSEGEKEKLALVRLLLSNPSAMLLDEPSNNLDITGLNFLSKFLRHFRGSFVLVSHDRWLLDQVTNRTLSLQPTKEGRVIMRLYKGNYSFYENAFKRELLQIENLYSDQQKIIRQAKKQRRLIKNRIATANVKFRRGKQNRSLGIMDLSKDAKWGRKLSAINKKISMAELRKKELPVFRNIPRRFSLGGSLAKGQHVLSGRKISFRINKQYLFRNANLDFYGQDRIAIIGENGCGKTTLLKIFLGFITKYEGELSINKNLKIGYLPQILYLGELSNTKVTDWFLSGIIGDSSLPRKILGAFNIRGEAQSKKLCELSKGMLRKVFLAKIVANNSDVIILDEPTNHMDIDTIEEIEQALLAFKGAVLVVSHDRYFLKNIGIQRIYRLTSEGLQETRL